jgi:hypothetical protein
MRLGQEICPVLKVSKQVSNQRVIIDDNPRVVARLEAF